MQRIEELKARIAKASARFEAAKSKILSPGDYEFVVLEAREEHDDKRGYDYWYLRLECDGQATSDRFRLIDDDFKKIKDLLKAVGLELESLKDIRDLIGRSGRLVAVVKGEWTIYEYQPKG
jgi:hypothetical protein